VPPSCALLGRFAIGARVSLLLQHSTRREMSASACTRSVPGLSSAAKEINKLIRSPRLRSDLSFANHFGGREVH